MSDDLIIMSDDKNKSHNTSTVLIDFSGYLIQYETNSSKAGSFDRYLLNYYNRQGPNIECTNPAGDFIFFAIDSFSPINQKSKLNHDGSDRGYHIIYYNGEKNRFSHGIKITSHIYKKKALSAEINMSPQTSNAPVLLVNTVVFDISKHTHPSNMVMYITFYKDMRGLMGRTHHLTLELYNSQNDVSALLENTIASNQMLAFNVESNGQYKEINLDVFINNPTLSSLNPGLAFSASVEKTSAVKTQLKELFSVSDLDTDDKRKTKLIHIQMPGNVRHTNGQITKNSNGTLKTIIYTADEFEKGSLTLPVVEGERKYGFSIRATDGFDQNNLSFEKQQPDGYVTVTGN